MALPSIHLPALLASGAGGAWRRKQNFLLTCIFQRVSEGTVATSCPCCHTIRNVLSNSSCHGKILSQTSSPDLFLASLPGLIQVRTARSSAVPCPHRESPSSSSPSSFCPSSTSNSSPPLPQTSSSFPSLSFRSKDSRPVLFSHMKGSWSSAEKDRLDLWYGAHPLTREFRRLLVLQNKRRVKGKTTEIGRPPRKSVSCSYSQHYETGESLSRHVTNLPLHSVTELTASYSPSSSVSSQRVPSSSESPSSFPSSYPLSTESSLSSPSLLRSPSISDQRAESLPSVSMKSSKKKENLLKTLISSAENLPTRDLVFLLKHTHKLSLGQEKTLSYPCHILVIQFYLAAVSALFPRLSSLSSSSLKALLVPLLDLFLLTSQQSSSPPSIASFSFASPVDPSSDSATVRHCASSSSLSSRDTARCLRHWQSDSSVFSSGELVLLSSYSVCSYPPSASFPSLFDIFHPLLEGICMRVIRYASALPSHLLLFFFNSFIRMGFYHVPLINEVRKEILVHRKDEDHCNKPCQLSPQDISMALTTFALIQKERSLRANSKGRPSRWVEEDMCRKQGGRQREETVQGLHVFDDREGDLSFFPSRSSPSYLRSQHKARGEKVEQEQEKGAKKELPSCAEASFPLSYSFSSSFQGPSHMNLHSVQPSESPLSLSEHDSCLSSFCRSSSFSLTNGVSSLPSSHPPSLSSSSSQFSIPLSPSSSSDSSLASPSLSSLSSPSSSSFAPGRQGSSKLKLSFRQEDGETHARQERGLPSSFASFANATSTTTPLLELPDCSEVFICLLERLNRSLSLHSQALEFPLSSAVQILSACTRFHQASSSSSSSFVSPFNSKVAIGTRYPSSLHSVEDNRRDEDLFFQRRQRQEDRESRDTINGKLGEACESKGTPSSVRPPELQLARVSDASSLYQSLTARDQIHGFEGGRGPFRSSHLPHMCGPHADNVDFSKIQEGAACNEEAVSLSSGFSSSSFRSDTNLGNEKSALHIQRADERISKGVEGDGGADGGGGRRRGLRCPEGVHTSSLLISDTCQKLFQVVILPSHRETWSLQLVASAMNAIATCSALFPSSCSRRMILQELTGKLLFLLRRDQDSHRLICGAKGFDDSQQIVSGSVYSYEGGREEDLSKGRREEIVPPRSLSASTTTTERMKEEDRIVVKGMRRFGRTVSSIDPSEGTEERKRSSEESTTAFASSSSSYSKESCFSEERKRERKNVRLRGDQAEQDIAGSRDRNPEKFEDPILSTEERKKIVSFSLALHALGKQSISLTKEVLEDLLEACSELLLLHSNPLGMQRSPQAGSYFSAKFSVRTGLDQANSQDCINDITRDTRRVELVEGSLYKEWCVTAWGLSKLLSYYHPVVPTRGEEGKILEGNGSPTLAEDFRKDISRSLPSACLLKKEKTESTAARGCGVEVLSGDVLQQEECRQKEEEEGRRKKAEEQEAPNRAKTTWQVSTVTATSSEYCHVREDKGEAAESDADTEENEHATPDERETVLQTSTCTHSDSEGLGLGNGISAYSASSHGPHYIAKVRQDEINGFFEAYTSKVFRPLFVLLGAGLMTHQKKSDPIAVSQLADALRRLLLLDQECSNKRLSGHVVTKESTCSATREERPFSTVGETDHLFTFANEYVSTLPSVSYEDLSSPVAKTVGVRTPLEDDHTDRTSGGGLVRVSENSHPVAENQRLMLPGELRGLLRSIAWYLVKFAGEFKPHHLLQTAWLFIQLNLLEALNQPGYPPSSLSSNGLGANRTGKAECSQGVEHAAVEAQVNPIGHRSEDPVALSAAGAGVSRHMNVNDDCGIDGVKKCNEGPERRGSEVTPPTDRKRTGLCKPTFTSHLRFSRDTEKAENDLSVCTPGRGNVTRQTSLLPSSSGVSNAEFPLSATPSSDSNGQKKDPAVSSESQSDSLEAITTASFMGCVLDRLRELEPTLDENNSFYLQRLLRSYALAYPSILKRHPKRIRKFVKRRLGEIPKA
ncbi:hypothetical protein CSUI_002661 [Cystoisospora suis]|uniref:Uncharacterized protein n=1 Tax=Cystoisospora suis TaxID=483139 RepID=A0A2C6L7Z7_9APIC|nr:hypothetical protein CSUI_002661 [Cystoisospora suis]